MAHFLSESEIPWKLQLSGEVHYRSLRVTTLLSCKVRSLLEQLVQQCSCCLCSARRFYHLLNWENPLQFSASFQVFSFTCFLIPPSTKLPARRSPQAQRFLFPSLYHDWGGQGEQSSAQFSYAPTLYIYFYTAMYTFICIYIVVCYA